MLFYNLFGGHIQHVPTAEAIQQRHVDLGDAALYEQLGVCFGRAPQKTELQCEKKAGTIERFL